MATSRHRPPGGLGRPGRQLSRGKRNSVLGVSSGDDQTCQRMQNQRERSPESERRVRTGGVHMGIAAQGRAELPKRVTDITWGREEAKA